MAAAKTTKKRAAKGIKRRKRRATPQQSLYEQFRAMAEERLAQGHDALERALSKTKDKAIRAAHSMIADAQKVLHSVGGGGQVSTPFGGRGRSTANGSAAASKPRKAGGRIRRDKTQLESDAREAFAIIKDRGDGGITASELKAQLEKQNVKVGPNLKGFIKENAGETVKVKGRGANAIYTAA